MMKTNWNVALVGNERLSTQLRNRATVISKKTKALTFKDQGNNIDHWTFTTQVLVLIDILKPTIYSEIDRNIEKSRSRVTACNIARFISYQKKPCFT